MMRSIVQPGPAVPERIQWAEARGRAFSFTLEAGLPLLEAARRGFAEEGFAGGTLNIRGGALGPFAYVMPALSKTGENAAFYSETFRPAGIVRLKTGAMTLGRRDGGAFFHCHALWTEAETTSRAFALRLRPNQDFAGALEAFCRDRGIASAKLHGGVGSTIGARFMDGGIVEPFATELAIRSGTIVSGADGALEARLDVALVDYTGGLAEGRLVRGDNPVLMTMELVLEVLG
jgi:predicted DNA-binding protein with PD1-like motif